MSAGLGQRIDDFLAGTDYAVVGASTDRSKFGNIVLRAYVDRGLHVVPVNPKEPVVEGLPTKPDLASLDAPVHGVSIVTPPPVTEKVVEQAIVAGVKRIWMQPGAENDRAVRRAEEAGLSVISGGPCILVEFRRRG